MPPEPMSSKSDATIKEQGSVMYELLRAGWPQVMAARQIMPSRFVPEWQVYVFGGTSIGGGHLVVGPLTFWSFTHGLRLPMVSMLSRGMRELDRDRRRYPR